MIEQVVTRRDRREHVAHGSRRGLPGRLRLPAQHQQPGTWPKRRRPELERVAGIRGVYRPPETRRSSSTAVITGTFGNVIHNFYFADFARQNEVDDTVLGLLVGLQALKNIPAAARLLWAGLPSKDGVGRLRPAVTLSSRVVLSAKFAAATIPQATASPWKATVGSFGFKGRGRWCVEIENLAQVPCSRSSDETTFALRRTESAMTLSGSCGSRAEISRRLSSEQTEQLRVAAMIPDFNAS